MHRYVPRFIGVVRLFQDFLSCRLSVKVCIQDRLFTRDQLISQEEVQQRQSDHFMRLSEVESDFSY